MHSSIADKLIGITFCLIGLFFIFDRRVEKFGLLYLFDGAWKESSGWRKWKRIILGLIIFLAGLVAFFHGSVPGELVTTL
jgi:hypothetical protein